MGPRSVVECYWDQNATTGPAHRKGPETLRTELPDAHLECAALTAALRAWRHKVTDIPLVSGPAPYLFTLVLLMLGRSLRMGSLRVAMPIRMFWLLGLPPHRVARGIRRVGGIFSSSYAFRYPSSA